MGIKCPKWNFFFELYEVEICLLVVNYHGKSCFYLFINKID